MTDLHTHLNRRNGKWYITARKGAEQTTEAVWVSIGGCTCHLTAVQVWLACLEQDKR